MITARLSLAARTAGYAYVHGTQDDDGDGPSWIGEFHMLNTDSLGGI